MGGDLKMSRCRIRSDRRVPACGSRTPPLAGFFGRTLSGLILVSFAMVSATAVFGQEWPQFRGPGRDGVYSGEGEVVPFPASGPEVVWERPIGAGFSAPVVAGGRVLVFHRQGNQEVLEALRADSGERLWRFSYETTYRDDFGFDNGPRATPVVSGKRVYTFGAQGLLHAVDLKTGARIWNLDTHAEFGVSKGFFGAASTPIVMDGRILANVGGRAGAGIVALDADSGKTLWKATDHEASYSSPVAARLDGKSAAVFFTRQGLAVVEPSSGEVLYERRWRSRSRASVNASTPLVSGDFVFLSASYGTGAIAMKLCNREIEELWSGEGVIDNHYSSCVLYDKTLFGFHGRQEYGQSFRAVDLRSGELLWAESAVRPGSVTRVGNQLLLLLESGELVVAKASREGFEEISRAQILSRETRAFPAVANGMLFARDQDTLVCTRLWTE